MKEVLEFLDKYLLRKIIDDTKRASASNWFLEFSDDLNVDGNRFLLCMAIDIKYDLINPESLIKIITDIEFSLIDKTPLMQFDELIHFNPSHYFEYSKCCDYDYAQERYASVVNWSKLFRKINNYLPLTGDYRMFDLADEAFVFSCVFEQNSITLKDVKEWNGWKGITWLLPLSDLNELMKVYLDDNDRINFVMDTLGLEPIEHTGATGSYDIPIYIEYPDKFPHKCYQPNSLCGFWKEPGGLYLSFKRLDGHGRTYSTTGKTNQGKERITREQEYGSADCVPKVLGFVTKPIIKDRTNILAEAKLRFG